MELTTFKKPENKEVDKNSSITENPVISNGDQKQLQVEELKEALNNALDMVEGKQPRRSLSDILHG